MKKYYYSDGQNQYGPFTIEELKEKNITQDTLIWYEGLAQWTKAELLPELQNVYIKIPQPIPQPTYNHPPNNPNYNNPYASNTNLNKPYPPKTWMLEAILVTLFCCLPFGIVGIVFASKVNNLYAMGDYDGAKRASDNAKTWTLIAFFAGILIWLSYIIITIFFASIFDRL